MEIANYLEYNVFSKLTDEEKEKLEESQGDGDGDISEIEEKIKSALADSKGELESAMENANETIKDLNVDSCYYLGKINHNIPFLKTYSCYGLCLNDYIKSPDGFKLDMPEAEINGKTYSIEKMKFSRAIKGECSDSLVLSSCMLLISYIS
jgi:hypothetical protein